MPEETKREEGVYGENLENGSINDERGIREETVEAHPQPVGDAASDPAGADAADDVKARGAEAIEGSEGSVAEDLDAVRRGAAQETGSGGGGRTETPRNDAAPEGKFTAPDEYEETTPG